MGDFKITQNCQSAYKTHSSKINEDLGKIAKSHDKTTMASVFGKDSLGAFDKFLGFLEGGLYSIINFETPISQTPIQYAANNRLASQIKNELTNFKDNSTEYKLVEEQCGDQASIDVFSVVPKEGLTSVRIEYLFGK